MDAEKVYIVTNPFSEYEKKVDVSLTAGRTRRSVRIVSSKRPGVTLVSLSRVNPGEVVHVVNPEALPFYYKLKLLGVPPCPRCRRKLRGGKNNVSFGCDFCRVVWTTDQLEFAYQGRSWGVD